MRFCGISVMPEFLTLCTLEEVRTDEPPVRLRATFYEPGSPERVAGQVRALEDVVVALAAPARKGPRRCDHELRRLGVMPHPPTDAGAAAFRALADLGVYVPAGPGPDGEVQEGSHHAARLFETNVDGVFCALQGRRVPAKRHPLGMTLRIQELLDDRVLDDDEELLWSRRIEEIDAAGAALCAHRFAVGHATWLGEPEEGIVVLPGTALPERFSAEGVLPPLRRQPLHPGG